MDCQSARPSTKMPTKFSGVFCRVTKAWKSVSSVAVSGTESHTCDCGNREVEVCDGNFSGKIHPQPCKGMRDSGGDVIDTSIVHELFDALSSLKLAYIQYQQGHIPYDAAKIRSADELVVSCLKSVSDLEHLQNGKKKIKPPTLAFLNAEISQQEELLESLHIRLQEKDSEILRLGWEIDELVQRNIELEEEIKRAFSSKEEVLFLCRDSNVTLLTAALEAASKSIHEFTKPVIGLMKASGWNLDCAADSVVASVNYAERPHKKYAFEASISSRMFSLKGGIPTEFRVREDIESVMRFHDPFDALINDPHSNFSRFCLSKYVSIIHPDMELAFFGHHDQRNFIIDGRHPRTPFYRAFVKMARWVWVLLVLAATIDPKAKMFYAKKGSKYAERYMESIVNVDGSMRSTVSFTVTPGFWVGNSEILRCRVYLS